jgi:hypothetical protein
MSHPAHVLDLLDDLPGAPDCGAQVGGQCCQAASTVEITTALTADTTVIVWRCDKHIDDHIALAMTLAAHPILAVTPVDGPVRRGAG